MSAANARLNVIRDLIARLACPQTDKHLAVRAPDLISGHASKGYSGHQFSDALERPFLHLFTPDVLN
jgi:hypothetical protein